ncbi:MAG: uridine kinase [Candidatus Avigastranaerophilus sp.]
MSIKNIVQRENHQLNKTNIDNTSIIAFRIIDGIKDILEEDRKQSQPLFLSINEKMLMMIVKNIINNPQKHYMVGITGESASGKTTLVNNISEAMRKKLFDDAYTCIYCDDYYIDTSKELKDAGSYENLYKTGFSFDTPKAINLDLMRAHLISLKNGCGIYGPEYDFVSCESMPNRIYKKPTRAILSEGLYVLGEELADLFDIKVYVYTPFDKIKERWFSRAISRGKTGAAAEHQFKDVTQTAQIHIRPTMQKADIVINGLTSAEYIEQISTRMINLIRDIINFYK